MRAIALLLAFLLELAALVALVYAGYHSGLSRPLDIVLAILLAATFIAVWGRYMAPHAPRRLAMPAYRIVKLLLFAAAAIALALTGQPIVALIFAILVIVDELLLAALLGGRTES